MGRAQRREPPASLIPDAAIIPLNYLPCNRHEEAPLDFNAVSNEITTNPDLRPLWMRFADPLSVKTGAYYLIAWYLAFLVIELLRKQGPALLLVA